MTDAMFEQLFDAWNLCNELADEHRDFALSKDDCERMDEIANLIGDFLADHAQD